MADNKAEYTCRHGECAGRGIITFKTFLEFKRHTDKHERPYKCHHADCQKRPGFTYAGGLMRHQREVHKMHGQNATLHCPHLDCARSTGNGFSRRENLEEHLKRRHHSKLREQSYLINAAHSTSAEVAAQDSFVKKRILEESRAAAQRQPRRPQSKWFKVPNLPGMAAFDLTDGMVQLPVTKTKKLERSQTTQHPYDLSVIPGAATWTSDEHSARMMAELDMLEEVASTSSSPSSSSSNAVDWEVPLFRSVQISPISQTDLIKEVRGIYAGLVMVEKKCADIVASQSSRRLDDLLWEELVALHRTLLAEHHDFFSATQHPIASDALKKLAMKYAMPTRMWQNGIRDSLDLLKHHLPASQDALASFTHLTHTAMQQLERDVPQLSHEWDLLKYNLKEYFAALRADGFDIPKSFVDCWEQQYSPTTQLLKWFFTPMTGNFFGDDEMSERYFWAHFHSEARTTRDTEENAHVPLSQLAQNLMAGWLSYGRKIATSFHAFTHVFIFLALLGATAYSMNPEY